MANDRGRKDLDRHEITYEAVQWHGTVRIQAVCACKQWQSVPYWARERAEGAAHDHLTTYRKGRKEKEPST